MPAAVLAGALLCESGRPAAATTVPPRGEIVRGVTISTHTDGRDWASSGMVDTMREIRETGAGWVAIHPYAGIRADGTVRFWPIDSNNPPDWLAKPIREAHAQGLKIFITPHLAYWGSPFRWRGDIGFETEEQWQRFWTGYESWITQLAAACHDADGFAVGSELDRTLGFEKEWRELIAAVRNRTGAALTYAANWDRFEEVPFWDALDAIGIQAYFPLTENPDPDEQEIRRGWERWMTRLRSFSAAKNRTIVFTELGYSRTHDAPVRPWDGTNLTADAAALQETCLRVALEEVDREPSIAGVFLWKWFPGPRPVGRNFELATPGLKRVITGAWRR